MIEWWQAGLFALLSALVAGVLAIASGVVGWFLNARTAREMQERQQEYDARMLERRLQDDRALRKNEVLRTAKEARLQPIFDALADLEQSLGSRIARRFAEEKGWKEFFESIEQELDKAPTIHEICFRLLGYSYRIRDPDIRGELVDTAKAAIGLSEEDREWLKENLAAVHARLEAHLIEQQTDDEPGP